MSWYDVFINFRGADTRKNFVSHLYAALANAGISTFLDDDELKKGMPLRPGLCEAIERSRISIVVFSQRYAKSTWCLDELVQIMQCQRTMEQVVLPVFYDVSPSDVRNHKGTFGEALKAHSQRYMGMTSLVSSWKRALTQAGNLAGWDTRNRRSDNKVVMEIVGVVLEKLDITYLSITDFPVGLESRVQDVIQFLNRHPKQVCKVGVWGMGGIGKTTIAKVVYNKIRHNFKYKCFLSNIREAWEKERGQIDLQEQLLSNILEKRKMKVHSAEWGKDMIKKTLCRKKALVVFDDVDMFEQLNALCGNGKWIGLGSVVIVTTRDKRLLKTLKVDYVCGINGMDVNESLELFSWHSFGEASPREDFNALSRKVITFCEGLPLALEVLGSYLYERTQEEWKSVLSKLEKIPNHQIQEKLRISFDGLKDHMEKNIFLDISCFFIGKDRAYVTDILNGCGLHADIGISVLIERSLVRVEKNNKLGMHALLRDMGREIVRVSSPEEPEKRSRLWIHEDILDVLTDHTGTKAIEGLSLKFPSTSRVCFNTIAFEKMKRLKLLQLDHVQLSGDYEYLPRHLIWLSWQGFHLKYIPENFYLKDIVAIDLKCSHLKQVWKKPQFLERLNILNLSHSMYLTSTPNFSELPNLKGLILKDCPNLSMIHESIGDLSNLLLINLTNCTSLSYLPKKIYKMKSLKTLILSGCSKIDKLEEDIVQMESLTTLIADNTGIKQVPFSIIRSKSIGYISLSGYEGFARDVFPSLLWSWMSPTMNPVSCIPSNWSTSSSLTFMDVQNNNLGHLPSMVRSLSNLRSFCVQCDTEFQLSQELKRIFDNRYYDIKSSDLDTTSYAVASQMSKHSLRSLLIGMGSYQEVLDALSKSVSEGITSNGSSDFYFPDDNFPSWLTHIGEGNSVFFKVPNISDWFMKGMILCVVYSSPAGNMVDDRLISVLIVNYTKCTIQIYKQGTIISFNDEDWHGLTSHLGSGDKVEIFVIFGDGLIVKKTVAYLIYDEVIKVETDPSLESKEEPKEDSNKELNKNAFVRFIKKIVMCSS